MAGRVRLGDLHLAPGFLVGPKSRQVRIGIVIFIDAFADARLRPIGQAVRLADLCPIETIIAPLAPF
jgi:hypothetical protein